MTVEKARKIEVGKYAYRGFVVQGADRQGWSIILNGTRETTSTTFRGAKQIIDLWFFALDTGKASVPQRWIDAARAARRAACGQGENVPCPDGPYCRHGIES